MSHDMDQFSDEQLEHYYGMCRHITPTYEGTDKYNGYLEQTFVAFNQGLNSEEKCRLSEQWPIVALSLCKKEYELAHHLLGCVAIVLLQELDDRASRENRLGRFPAIELR